MNPQSRLGRDPAELLADLDARYPGRLRHVLDVPARRARYEPLPDWVSPPVRAALAGAGIDRLWSHQREAAERAWAGEHVVLATGTASGKSLGYLLPTLSAVLDGRSVGAGRSATALYLSPTKALAADQLARIESWAIPGIRAATYDGDTPSDERRWIREHADIVFSNPDLVHHSLLPGHQRWSPFLRALRFIVIDECHVYRGVFGSHVALVLRRLLRIAARYGAEPTVVLASATVAEPAAHAARLVGAPVHAVTEDGSPRGALTLGLWQPETDEDGAQRSATTEAGGLVADLVAKGAQTLAFARSRAGSEALAIVAERHLDGWDWSGAAAGSGVRREIAAYRGGYLPEERRVLERELREGRLRGLAATNALELGVDIAGLDAVVLAGWPGRQASFWQQVGRAGRDGSAALGIFVAGDDPLDAWVVEHPASLTTPTEAAVLDPSNVHVLAPHVAAAAAELPVTLADERWFGPSLGGVLRVLTERRVLRKRPTGWYWARADRPGDHVSLRGIGEVVSIVEGRTGRVVGTIEEASAHAQVHTGAVHVHQGETYVVTELDLPSATATVVRGDPGWSTTASSTSAFDVLSVDQSVSFGAITVSRGAVRVRRQVVGFLRRLPGGEILGVHPLDLPEQVLNTRAVWWTIDPEAAAEAGVEEVDLPGSLHAAEHASIGVLPLLATCDRWDIGGVSTALHPDTELPTVMVYDGHPGGAGFADRAYDAIRDWTALTLDVVDTCGCSSGCPRCVQSPKCGNGNEPLHKLGAVKLLQVLLSSLPSKTPEARS